MPVEATAPRGTAATTASALESSIALNMAAIAGQDRTVEVGDFFRSSGITNRSVRGQASGFAEHAGRWEQYAVEGTAGEADAEMLRSIAERAAREFGILIVVGETFENESGRYANYVIINNAYIPENLSEEDRQFLLDAMRAAESYIGTEPGKAKEINDIVVAYIKAAAWLENLQRNPPSMPEMPGWTGAMKDIFPELDQMPEEQRWIFEGFAERGFRSIEDGAYSRLAGKLEEAIGYLRSGLEQLASGGEDEGAFGQASTLLGQAADIQNFFDLLHAYTGRIDGIRRSWQALSRMEFEGVAIPALVEGLREKRDEVVELRGNAQWHLTRAFFLLLAGRGEEAAAEEQAAESALENAQVAMDVLNSAYGAAQERQRLARDYLEAADRLAKIQFQGVESRQAVEFLEAERDRLVDDLRDAAKRGEELAGLEERANELDRLHRNAAEYEAFVRNARNSILGAISELKSNMNARVQQLADFWKSEEISEMLRQLPDGGRISQEFASSDAELEAWKTENIDALGERERAVRRICDHLLSSYSPETLEVNEGAATLAEKFGFESSSAFGQLRDEIGEIAYSSELITTTISGRAWWMEREIGAAIPPNIYALPGVEATETALAARINVMTTAAVVGASPIIGMAAGAACQGVGAFFATRVGAVVLEYGQALLTGYGSYELSAGFYEYFSAGTEAERQAALDHLRNGALLIGIPVTRLAGMPAFINRALAAAAPLMQATALATGGVVLSHDIARWSREGVEPLTLAMDIFAIAVPAWGLRGVFRGLLPGVTGFERGALAAEGAGGGGTTLRVPTLASVPQRTTAFAVSRRSGGGAAEETMTLEDVLAGLKNLGLSEERAQQLMGRLPFDNLSEKLQYLQIYSEDAIAAFRVLPHARQESYLLGDVNALMEQMERIQNTLAEIKRITSTALRKDLQRYSPEIFARFDYNAHPEILFMDQNELYKILHSDLTSAERLAGSQRLVREHINRYLELPPGLNPNIQLTEREVKADLEIMGFRFERMTNGHKKYVRYLEDGSQQVVNLDGGLYPRSRLRHYLTQGVRYRPDGTTPLNLNEGDSLLNELISAHNRNVTGYSTPEIVIFR